MLNGGQRQSCAGTFLDFLNTSPMTINKWKSKIGRRGDRCDFPGAKGGTRQVAAHGRQARLCQGAGGRRRGTDGAVGGGGRQAQRQALWEARLCQGPRAAGSGGGVQTERSSCFFLAMVVERKACCFFSMALEPLLAL